MFESTTSGWTRSATAAVAAHALLIVSAVVGSTRAVDGAVPIREVLLAPPFEPRDSRAARGGAPSRHEVIDVPSVPPLGDVPVCVLAGDLGGPFDLPLSSPVSPGGPAGPAGGALAGAVDDPPELLSAPLPAYPELLRRAGITARVIVEAVVDTTGRAEAGSMRAIGDAHTAFQDAARESVRRALFRPARVRGQAVRALVRVPVEFRL
ncbi:MAG: energy transducer TonB, partial [Gemmatimonadales bacterium]